MRMYTFAGALVVATLLSGCMANARDGSSSYECSGAGKGWGDCRKMADARCGVDNYTVISGEGGAEPAKAGGNTEMKRVLVVRCK